MNRVILPGYVYRIGGAYLVVGESLADFGTGASPRRKVRPYVAVPRRWCCGRDAILVSLDALPLCLAKCLEL